LNHDAVPTAGAIAALFLGTMQGRAAAVQARLARRGVAIAAPNLGASGPYTWIPILLGSLAAAAWAWQNWPWYCVVIAMVAFAFCSWPLINRRTVRSWMALRVASAVGIVCAAVVLWTVY
jgi:hypothetical protein